MGSVDRGIWQLAAPLYYAAWMAEPEEPACLAEAHAYAWPEPLPEG